MVHSSRQEVEPPEHRTDVNLQVRRRELYNIELQSEPSADRCPTYQCRQMEDAKTRRLSYDSNLPILYGREEELLRKDLFSLKRARLLNQILWSR